MNEFGLSEDTIGRLKSVFSTYPKVEKVVLYGSRAKGNFKNASDIDLTLFGEGITLSEMQTMELEIDDLLLPYKVDLSVFTTISNLDLQEHIRRVGCDFYTRT